MGEGAEERVLVVEFRRRRPFEVVTAGGPVGGATYDVEWCRRDRQFYTHMSGGGYVDREPHLLEHRRATYWAADGTVVVDGGRRLSVLPSPCRESWPWEGAEEVEALLWCAVCEDWLPDGPGWAECGTLLNALDDPHLYLCEHLWWCDECSVWTGAGSFDPCPHPWEWIPGTPLDGSAV